MDYSIGASYGTSRAHGEWKAGDAMFKFYFLFLTQDMTLFTTKKRSQLDSLLIVSRSIKRW